MIPTTRREARERALELLYEAEAKHCHPVEVVDDLPLRPDQYAVELATGVADHQIEIDAVLGRYAERWPVSRMPVMDRAALRLGAFELAVKPEVPTGAALSEAVELASRYGSSDDTGRFVNGILARVADEVRDGPRPWHPITVVVFDMDGVFRHWRNDRLAEVEDAIGIPEGAIAAAAFEREPFRAAMVGEMTDVEWSADIGRRVADAHGCDPGSVAAAWDAAGWDLHDDVVGLARAVGAAGTRVAVFSNASTRLDADLVTMGLDGVFDVVANSSRLGLTKPDVDAFGRVAELLDVEPARILFTDDQAANVAGAVEAGWHAVEWRGPDRFTAVLGRLGVPVG